jgi:hypothetical protein
MTVSLFRSSMSRPLGVSLIYVREEKHDESFIVSRTRGGLEIHGSFTSSPPAETAMTT